MVAKSRSKSSRPAKRVSNLAIKPLRADRARSVKGGLLLPALPAVQKVREAAWKV